VRETIELIKKLSDIPGVSGCEGAVREEISALIKDHCQTVEADTLGNLLAFKKGARPGRRIMVSAHMDEVGLIITHIEEDGLLLCSPVGGIDTRVAFGRAVEIGPQRLPGVIGGKALHHLDGKERETPPGWEVLRIDIGAVGREEAQAVVAPGQRVVFSSQFVELGEEYILGRAFDDRAGCALLIQLIRAELPWDCHFVFTVQEETGCTGAATAAYAMNPEVGIAVEATTAADIPGTPPGEQICRLGGGPVLSYMDKGTVYDKELYDLALGLARERGIACQSKAGVSGGNESRAVQSAGAGARVMAVNLPCRYLHSPSLMLHKGDIAEAHKLLLALIETLGQQAGF